MNLVQPRWDKPEQSIVRTVPKPMSYMRKRRTAARMRAKGFSARVIKEQIWGVV